MTPQYDIAVVGSGYAGSLIAMIAKRLGHSVVLLERGKHPRVVIGESSTPLSNLLLETLADRYNLPALHPLTRWGTWQQTYPQVGCGLKRGFSFFHHDLGANSANPLPADRHLLVAASPNNTVADTHWFRADVDQFLVHQTQALGITYLDEIELHQMTRSIEAWTLSGQRHGQDVSLRARFVIDATGPRGFLHRVLHLKEAALPNYPTTSALYSHFAGVADFHGTAAIPAAPYPPNASALHHVFNGGWMWVLRFNNGWTSAGFSVSEDLASRFRFNEKESAWNHLLNALPQVRQQFANATPKLPLTWLPRLPFRSASIAGEGWAMLPSAAGFVDPLLSTGFPLTLLGVSRLAEILERDWDSPTLASSLHLYAQQTDTDLLATAELISALYANMGDFSTFRTLSLLYFAAASYAETVRRLNKPELAVSFLLHDHPIFGPVSRRILKRARQPLTAAEKLELHEQIYRLIQQFDVAGLCKRPDNHCYPVNAEDLFAAASKVDASGQDIETLLYRSGFFNT